ncbi:DUF3823 domain-containing protein [Prevotella sp. 10(H)]|uniref:DUF3823 domain-containing protein n=1 Tax=Prevotella sp. 10(H) TaxID=1158294 RepID=UPI0004A6B80C|nr:DUF3823 domain-containing protein [Prevotella sp. 10(H)]
MKKIALYTLLCALFSFSSCSMFEIDNYDEPKETLQGEVVDAATGKRVLTDQGREGTYIRLTELSWGENVQHNPDFNCMSDGTFQNTKLFKGTYHIDVIGAFIPLLREDANGTPIADDTQTMEIKGVTKVKFEVQPFLNIEWVGEPTISNGKVTAKIRVTRGVSEAEFKNKIEPMGGYDNNFVNVTDVRLFVSYSSSVGYGTSYDNDQFDPWSGELSYSGSDFSPLLGEVITIQSKGTIPSGRTVFVRAAARINYGTPKGSGTRRYNYNEAKELMVP